MASSDPVKQLNEKVAGSLDSFLKLPPCSSTKGALPWEKYAGRLADGCSQPTLVLSDLSSNYSALLSALLLRNLVEVEPNGIRLTTDGQAVHLIINGDLNDRGKDLIPCLWLISHLRNCGMKISTVVGNHEAYLLSLLVYDPIESFDISDLKLKLYTDPTVIERMTVSPADWAEGFSFWYLVNKGAPTVYALAQFNDYISSKQRRESLPYEYHQELIHYQIEPDVVEGARSAIIRSPLCREFVNNLVGCVVDTGIVFAHASLPRIPFLPGGFLRNLNELLTDAVFDPETCWRMSMGIHYSGQKYHSSKYPNAHMLGAGKLQGDYGDLGELIWARFPRGIAEKFSSFSGPELPEVFGKDWLGTLGNEGVRALVRGHDSVDRMGISDFKVLPRHGVNFLNVDVDLAAEGSLGYAFIDQSGHTFGFRTKGHKEQQRIR